MPVGFWRTAIGKKAVMAVTGLILFGFVVGHLLGNLQIYLGEERIDAYSLFLRETPSVLWLVRLVLLAAVLLHVTAAVQLAAEARRARPVAYRGRRWLRASWSSRTMLLSGVVILGFVVFHLLHLTFGTVHPDFDAHRVYRNVVLGFQRPGVSAFYLVAMVFLGLHLLHGLWSFLQSLGVHHPRTTGKLRRFATVAAVLLVLGYASMPIAVLAGLVR
jgi:succinate dehydrogenase / fumarate reductase, cytochrome b subunit